MTKSHNFILIAVLLFASFLLGVVYADSIKSHASWIFESKMDEEVELPDLSSEKEGGEIGATIGENGENLGAPNKNAVESGVSSVSPTENLQDNQEQNPAASTPAR
jgi:hypothetical protein